jgi:hypothetical protein
MQPPPSVDHWHMNSRVHPKYKTRYRVTNWAEYDKALVQRGDITLWITPEAIMAWKPRTARRRDAPRKYSNLAVETALTLRAVFRLPLRQAEGFLRSLLNLMGIILEAPDHTTLSRRSKELKLKLPLAHCKRPFNLIIDSTGLSIVGDGEWAGAIYKQAVSRGAKVVVPPTRSASVSKRGLSSAERDRTIRRVEQLGRREWKKRSGYHRQGTLENAFFRYKSMLHAWGLAAQRTEVAVACRVLNRRLQIGRPRSVALAR